VQLLLDKHVLIWWIAGRSELSRSAKTAISDPWDRMLAAQSIHETLHLISRDEDFNRYGVTRLW